MGARLRGDVGPALQYPGVSKLAVFVVFLVAIFCCIFVMLGFSGNYAHVWFRSTNFYILFKTLLLFACLCFGHFVHRLCLIWKERKLIWENLYKESLSQAVDYAFGGLTGDLYVLSIAVISFTLEKENLSKELLLCCVGSAAVGFLHHFLRSLSSDKKKIAEKNKLNIGYGLAYLYYYNYLDIILDKFKQRVRRFSMEQEISVFEKLMILVPYSCEVKKFIDEDPRKTMRIRELPPLKIDVASIKGRVYNITVYEVFLDDVNVKYFAIEYAQPLRQLFGLKEEISEEQMQNERTAFVRNLNFFLRDEKQSFESCVLVPYDNFGNLVNTLTAEAE